MQRGPVNSPYFHFWDFFSSRAAGIICFIIGNAFRERSPDNVSINWRRLVVNPFVVSCVFAGILRDLPAGADPQFTQSHLRFYSFFPIVYVGPDWRFFKIYGPANRSNVRTDSIFLCAALDIHRRRGYALSTQRHCLPIGFFWNAACLLSNLFFLCAPALYFVYRHSVPPYFNHDVKHPVQTSVYWRNLLPCGKPPVRGGYCFAHFGTAADTVLLTRTQVTGTQKIRFGDISESDFLFALT